MIRGLKWAISVIGKYSNQARLCFVRRNGYFTVVRVYMCSSLWLFCFKRCSHHIKHRSLNWVLSWCCPPEACLKIVCVSVFLNVNVEWITRLFSTKKSHILSHRQHSTMSHASEMFLQSFGAWIYLSASFTPHTVLSKVISGDLYQNIPNPTHRSSQQRDHCALP